MCVHAQTHKLRGGWPIDTDVQDPITGRVYDLRSRKDQNEVRNIIKRDKPISPRAFSEAYELMRFAVEMCGPQLRADRHFVFEQPRTSRARALEPVMKLMPMEDVTATHFHQCMYRLGANDQFGPAPACKPTRVLTNHPAFAEALSKWCDGIHRPKQLVGKSACARAAPYPHGLFRTMLGARAIIKKAREETEANSTNTN